MPIRWGISPRQMPTRQENIKRLEEAIQTLEKAYNESPTPYLKNALEASYAIMKSYNPSFEPSVKSV